MAAWAPAGAARARRGDPRARAIAAAGQEHLAALAGGVVRALQLPSPVRVSWSGGVAGNAWYRAGMRRALGRRFACRWQAPVIDPALAAARLASRLDAAATAGGQRAERRRSPVHEPMRRLVITVCPREPGVVVLPVERGGRARRLDAAAIARELRELIDAAPDSSST